MIDYAGAATPAERDRPITVAEEANERIAVLDDHLCHLTGLIHVISDRLFGVRAEGKENPDPRVAPSPPSGDLHRINFGLSGLNNRIDDLRRAIARLEN